MKAILIQKMRWMFFATLVAVTLTSITQPALAQNSQNGGRQRQRQGNFDPAQFQQRMLEPLPGEAGNNR